MAEVMAEYGLESVVKLASNESPFPPLPEVKAVIDEGLGGLNRYPDGAARSLRDALADRHADRHGLPHEWLRAALCLLLRDAQRLDDGLHHGHAKRHHQ